MAAKNNNINKLEQGTTIRLSKLPDCQFKTMLCGAVTDPDNTVIAVLATLAPGNSRKWVVYVGYPSVDDLKPAIRHISSNDYEWLCENVRDIEQVRIMGEKLPKEVAEQLFPDWKEKPYLED